MTVGTDDLLTEHDPGHRHRATGNETVHINTDAGADLHQGVVSGSSDLGGEHLVEQDLGLVLLDPLGQSELGDEDLPRLGQHPLLACGETALALAAPEVADNLSHLHDVARVQLLEVRLVATRPVGRLFGVWGTQHAEHALETIRIDDVPNPDEVQVASRDPDDQVGLAYDPKYEVEPVLTLDLAGFDVLDHGGP